MVSPELYMSDHRNIQFSLGSSVDTIKITRNYRKTDWTKYKPLLDLNINREKITNKA